MNEWICKNCGGEYCGERKLAYYAPEGNAFDPVCVKCFDETDNLPEILRRLVIQASKNEVKNYKK